MDSKTVHLPFTPRLAALAVTLLFAACAVPPQQAEQPAPAPAATAPARSVPPVPNLPPHEARALAQKQALEARDQLQNGEEDAARTLLEQAVQLDSSNEMARKLLDQIKADAQQELGGTHFSYTVQSGDTMAKLAERFLNDRLRFYILSKYNGISNPNRLGVGQVIKIPGQAPKQQPAPKPAPRPAEAAKQAETPKPQEAVKPVEAPEPPKVKAPPAQDPAQKQALVQRYTREALAAYHRQDLDGAIKKWDQVLQIDPYNETAKYNRAKALDLKQRIQKFPAK
ncbi:LysM peptidoglycan-binding domain-containing protein [Chitinivorax sp. PXF-14]|uniref:LysM peptidoglycan-binding domain-containing protein n=1 Tax=Chitinivorax sp. PXF-14 TaxID=3230488 RepID=UPI0034670F34